MMNYRNLTLIIFLLASTTVQCTKYSFDLEYRLGEKTKNSQGDLKITCNISHNTTQMGFERITVGLQYEDTPGLFGDLGHLRLLVNTDHSDKKINLAINSITNDINTILNYNPIKISQLDRLIIQLNSEIHQKKLLKQQKEKHLIEQENNLKKDKFLANKENFLLQKRMFESIAHNENDPNITIIRDIIKELEKEYGQ